jgi:alpha-L-arabinofuranosidase
MRSVLICSLALLLTAVGIGQITNAKAAAPIEIKIDVAKAGAPINPHIYGQFIEHLGRCIYGGIWAEMLEDRKFFFDVTDHYQPYGELKDTKFPVVSASPWEVIGPANSVTMIKDAAFVGEHSPRIAAGSGIRQNDLAVVAGKQYVGYVWLRAEKPSSNVRVSLAGGDGNAQRTAKSINPAVGDFFHFPFQFKATQSSDLRAPTARNCKSTFRALRVSSAPFR